MAVKKKLLRMGCRLKSIANRKITRAVIDALTVSVAEMIRPLCSIDFETLVQWNNFLEQIISLV